MTQVTDPSGRELNLTWQAQDPTASDGSYHYRIVSAAAPGQTVEYTYYQLNESGCGGAKYSLKSVTIDPSGLDRTTTYTYTTYTGPDYSVETGLLYSISDPLENTITYEYDQGWNNGGLEMTGTVWVSRVIEPGGIDSSDLPRTVTWGYAAMTAFSVASSYAPENEGSAVGVGVQFDSKFRVIGCGAGGSIGFNMLSTDSCYSRFKYDVYNNVTGKSEFVKAESDTNQAPYYRWFARMDNYEYSRHGNVKLHWLEGYEDKVDTYKYWGEEKYFQKKWVKDMAGNVTTFDYGVNTLQGADIGKRGNLLYVWDAKHEPVYVNNVGRDDPNGTIDPSNPANAVRYEYIYNTYGQKIEEINLNGVHTTYTYGNGIVTDPWNETDNVGNLIKVVQDPGGLNRTTWMEYDEVGRVTKRMDPKGQTSTVAYNNAGQPMTTSFPATQDTPAETVTYLYGDNGRLESVTDNRGTTGLEYEVGQGGVTGVGDRIASVDDPVTGTISYTYTPRGAVASKTLPSGRSWTYLYNNPSDPFAYTFIGTYDSSNLDSFKDRLDKIVDDEGQVICEDAGFWEVPGCIRGMDFNMTYDESGLATYCSTTPYCNTTSTTSSWGGTPYCTNGYTTKFVTKFYWLDENREWQSKVLCANEYEYDDVGNRTENKVYGENNVLLRTENYGYDELSRLTSVNYGDGTSKTYTFDNMGNRLSMSGTTYGYNAANMLTTMNGMPYATYDANGNQLTTDSRDNTWDSQNRLTRCETMNDVIIDFTYGADGLRRKMRVHGYDAVHYSYDGQNVAQEGHLDQNDNFVADVSYLVGPRGNECRIDENTEAARWYLYDGLGSVVGEVDEDGNVTYTAKYDVYGAARGSTGSSDSKHKFVGGIGHTSEPDTGGLIYMRARWYDPEAGRFISEDPKYDGDNWYAYCYNNPVNGCDPTGELYEAAYDAEVVAAGAFGLAAVLTLYAIHNADLTFSVATIGISFSKREAENKDFKRVADEMGLTDSEQEELHREISKRGVGVEELWDRAHDLVARRDPCGRRGGKPKRK